MTDDNTRAFLDSRLNYEARGMPALAELRVDRTAMLLDQLGRPHDRLRIVHVAGTKGKGSTSTMVAACADRAGLKVGLHTSPHLLHVEERFRIGEAPIPSTRFARMIDEMKPAILHVDRLLVDQPPLTFFEITTALALLYFQQEAVDLAVIEVGMGGRLDSTNVVDPAVSVITSISLDHMKQLGDTIPQIAFEKAGIIKPGRPVVSTVLDPLAIPVIERRAEETESPLYRLGHEFHATGQSRGLRAMSVEVETWRSRWPACEVRAMGEHQIRNAAAALATIDLLDQQQRLSKDPSITRETLAQGLASVRIPGRFEIVHRRPAIIFEVAHNPASFESLARTLRSVLPPGHRGKRTLLFAASRDKDWPAMLNEIAGLFTDIVLTSYSSAARALPGAEILPYATPVADRVEIIEPAREAWQTLLAHARLSSAPVEPLHDVGASMIGIDEDVLCAAGSFYLIADLLQRREISSTTR